MPGPGGEAWGAAPATGTRTVRAVRRPQPLLIVAAVVVVAVLVGGGVFVLSRDDDPVATAAPGPTTPGAPTTAAAPAGDPDALQTYLGGDWVVRDSAKGTWTAELPVQMVKDESWTIEMPDGTIEPIPGLYAGPGVADVLGLYFVESDRTEHLSAGYVLTHEMDAKATVANIDGAVVDSVVGAADTNGDGAYWKAHSDTLGLKISGYSEILQTQTVNVVVVHREADAALAQETLERIAVTVNHR